MPHPFQRGNACNGENTFKILFFRTTAWAILNQALDEGQMKDHANFLHWSQCLLG